MARRSLTDGEMVDGKKHGYWVTYYANGHKRSEGNYIHGKKDGPWITYHKNETRQVKPPSAMNKYEGPCITYHENGNLRSTGSYPKHEGKSYDGKKEGPFYGYEEDGKTMWLIVTYKKGGARANPMSIRKVCGVCGEGRRLAWGDTCPKCGAELERMGM